MMTASRVGGWGARPGGATRDCFIRVLTLRPQRPQREGTRLSVPIFQVEQRRGAIPVIQGCKVEGGQARWLFLSEYQTRLPDGAPHPPSNTQLCWELISIAIYKQLKLTEIPFL